MPSPTPDRPRILTVKTLRRLLLSAILLGFVIPGSSEEDKPSWSRAEAVKSAAGWLTSSNTFTKTQRDLAGEWLERLNESQVDLEQDLYLEALGLLAQNKRSEAIDRLVKAVARYEGLTDRACPYRTQLNGLLPKAYEKTLKERAYEKASALLAPMIDLGTGPLISRYEAAAKRLIRHRNPEAAPARTTLLTLAGNDSRLQTGEKDLLARQLYKNGKKSTPEAPESEAGKQPAGMNKPGYCFDKPDFLIMGGGGRPTSNQVSLENNVKFILRVQQDLGLTTNRNHILFADGQDAAPDLQVMDPKNKAPELNKLLAYLLGQSSGLDYRYRTHTLTEAQGTSSRENIQKYFDQLTLKKGQQLFLNFTGHGGSGEKNNKLNTSIHLWPNKSLRMKEFCTMLNQVPQEVPVVMLMVQCYAGGFARTIFKEGDPGKGLTDHLRCGFFSTVYSRPAAGCTPDIDQENYKEYSTYFLTALGGKGRLGTAIEKPDYNRDGQVSFAEAHAYALIESDTIDISVKTTDILLREYAQTRSRAEEWDGRLLDVGAYGQVWRSAGPNERAVLDGLARQLDLCGDDCIISAMRRIKTLDRERKALSEKIRARKTDLTKIKTELANYVRKEWPEIRNPWHPKVAQILEDETSVAETLYFIKKHSSYKKLESLREEISALGKQDMKLERLLAKYQRFFRTAEHVVLEANLGYLAEPDVMEDFKQLQELENGYMTCTSPEPEPEEEEEEETVETES